MKSGLTEKLKKKMASDGVQVDFDQVNTTISRNAVKAQKRLANQRKTSIGIQSGMGTGAFALGNMINSAEGKSEPETEFTETAQETKMRRAAEKRARRSMQ